MDDSQSLSQRVRELETALDALRQANDQLRQAYDALRQTLAERDARIEELEQELRRRGKNYRPNPNRTKTSSTKQDRRKKPHRKHGGEFRTLPDEIPDDQLIHHDIRPDACTCGCTEFVPSGDFDDHYQVDIPKPKPENHRFRRHKMECCQCGKVVQGRGEGELPGSHVGPRARLLACYARG